MNKSGFPTKALSVCLREREDKDQLSCNLSAYMELVGLGCRWGCSRRGRRTVRKTEGKRDGCIIQGTAAEAVECKRIVPQNFSGPG